MYLQVCGVQGLPRGLHCPNRCVALRVSASEPSTPLMLMSAVALPPVPVPAAAALPGGG